MCVRKRFLTAIEHLGYFKNKSAFAIKVNVPRNRLGKIEDTKDKKGVMPSIETLAQIAKKFPTEVNWDWVLRGEGKMKINDKQKGNYITASVVSQNSISYSETNSSSENKDYIIQLQAENLRLSKKVNQLLEEKLQLLQR